MGEGGHIHPASQQLPNQDLQVLALTDLDL